MAPARLLSTPPTGTPGSTPVSEERPPMAVSGPLSARQSPNIAGAELSVPHDGEAGRESAIPHPPGPLDEPYGLALGPGLRAPGRRGIAHPKRRVLIFV